MKKIIIMMAVIASALAIVSCEKYEDGRPSKEVRAEFKRMYSNASDVEWEWAGAYWEVSFRTGSRPYYTEHEARFEKTGAWLGTSTDVRLSQVPENVKKALSDDATYGSAQFADDDVDYIETPSGNFYRFDLVKDGVAVKVDVSTEGEVALAGYDF